MPTHLRSMWLLGLMVPLLAACNTRPADSPPENPASDPGRVAFEAVALPATGTMGADPQALARTLFGTGEPVEGNYSEEAVTLLASANQQVVLLTQLGLPDDSLLGMRHRLEFLPEGDQWQLSWAGRQVSCRPGRGHEDWGTLPCQ